MPDWQSKLDATIDQSFADLVEVRRHLHAHPEPSGHEHDTSLYLYQLLSEKNLDVQMGPEGLGVLASPGDKANGNDGGGEVAIRADIDALRINDQKRVAYRSQNPGIMHACGHDAHTATVLGAVIGLQGLAQSGMLPRPARWRAIFQPAEETATGAKEMIKAGALAGVKAIFATHMDPTRQVGHIGVRSGAMTACCDQMSLRILGRGGHAARPHESNDPIAAAAQLISTLYLFVPRATDSQDAVVITIGQLLGGDNPNVIPESVELRGTLRTLDRGVRQATIDHIAQLARGIAEASGTKIEVVIEAGVEGVCNDSQLTKILMQAAQDTVGSDRIERIARPSMGSEDFAGYLEHVPGAMFRLGCASDRAGNFGLHTPQFDVDEEAIRVGAKILARAVVLCSQADTPDTLENRDG